MTEEHEELILELTSGTFTAACVCGWMTEGHPSAETASDAWETHCGVVFIEATGQGTDLT